MQKIISQSGERHLRKDGKFYRRLDAKDPDFLKAFSSRGWSQNIGAPSDSEMPPMNPVKMVSFPQGTFFEKETGPVLVPAGDFLSRDADGVLSHVPAEDVKNYVAVRVEEEATRTEVEAAASKAIARIEQVRKVARAQSQNIDQSPISLKEDDQGRALLVSSLPDGREKVWKSFAWKEAAEKFLGDEKKHADLLKQHEKACRSARGVDDMAHAFRMARKADLTR
jgi:uncharacterized protein YifE (UPF0438 family)